LCARAAAPRVRPSGPGRRHDYVEGWPAAAVDGEFAIFYFDAGLGWAFIDRANRWHAAPQNYRNAPEYYYPHGSGLPGRHRRHGGEIETTTMPCVPIEDFESAYLVIADFDGVVIGVCYEFERGWRYYDKANRWHAAPERYRGRLDHDHPRGSGLANYVPPNGSQIAATPSSGA
jgi:hypothetical protein